MTWEPTTRVIKMLPFIAENSTNQPRGRQPAGQEIFDACAFESVVYPPVSDVDVPPKAVAAAVESNAFVFASKRWLLLAPRLPASFAPQHLMAWKHVLFAAPKAPILRGHDVGDYVAVEKDVCDSEMFGRGEVLGGDEGLWREAGRVGGMEREKKKGKRRIMEG